MRLSLRSLAILALCPATTPLRAADPQDPVTPRQKIQLFNGKDLTGWYTWTRDSKYEDPKKVFSVVNGFFASREKNGAVSRPSTCIVIITWSSNGNGPDRRWESAKPRLETAASSYTASAKTARITIPGWNRSNRRSSKADTAISFLVGGRNKPSLTAEVREGANNRLYWQEGGKRVTRDSGRFNWYGRDPDWKDEIGFRGKQDLEKPMGEWNRSEVICDRDTIKNLFNGKVVNYGTNSSHTFGKIQIQSEGAEIWIRRVDLQPIKR